MINVLLADDHRLLIEGLRPLLERQGDITVVGIAQNGFDTIKLAEELNPDIILLDISMPQLNGIDAARRIISQSPKIKIIMLSMHADQRFIQESLRVGASGYILKESAAQEVIEAVRIVSKGDVFFSASVRERVLQNYVSWLREGNKIPESPLTGREREVLQLLAEGKSTKDIADLLFVSIKTVESHRKQIMDKLNLHSIAELTKYAIKEGLTRLE
ncbi:MAG: response regulator transcription factor [Candidatus Zixiibacteriota bacterium]